MTSVKSSTCGPCKFRDICQTASVWCLVCKEGLCTGCKESHAGFKLFRSHAIIPYENVKDLPEIAKNVKEMCFDHDRKYEFYCSDHQEPCCIRCNTTNHKNCVSLCPIEDVIENVKSSVAIKHIDDGIISLISKIERVIEKKENSVLQIEEEATGINDKLQEIQKTICEKVNRQCSKLYEIRTVYNTHTAAVIRKLKENLDNLHETKVLFAMLKENGSNLQIFLCLKELEAILSKEENKYISIKEGGELDDLQVVFQPSLKITKLMSLLDVGHIEMKMRPLNLPTNCSEQSAKGNDETKPISYNIDNVRLKKKDALLITYTGFDIAVTSSVILSNDCMLFCDSKCKRLMMHDSNGVFLRDINMKSEPFGITAIGDLIVAVTLPKMKKVEFIELSSFSDKVIKEFETIGNCCGIDHENNQLVVSVEGIGIHIYDLDGNLLKTISLAGKAVIFHGSNICYLGKKSTFLRCCDYFGRNIWELQLPQQCDSSSIAKDAHGNMYIAVFDDIYIVQSDGSRYRKLTDSRNDKKDKTPRINGVHFNNRKNQLLCTNMEWKALLYDVSFEQK